MKKIHAPLRLRGELHPLGLIKRSVGTKRDVLMIVARALIRIQRIDSQRGYYTLPVCLETTSVSTKRTIRNPSRRNAGLVGMPQGVRWPRRARFAKVTARTSITRTGTHETTGGRTSRSRPNARTDLENEATHPYTYVLGHWYTGDDIDDGPGFQLEDVDQKSTPT